MSLEDWNYYNDPRVRASMRSRPWSVLASSRGDLTIQLAESLVSTLCESGAYEDGWDGELTVACEAEVCDLCRGHGRVVNPSIDAGGIGPDDDFWLDDYDDETGASRYHRGDYDVSCPECRGLRVVFAPRLPSAVAEAVAAWERDEAYYEAECRAERRMGC